MAGSGRRDVCLGRLDYARAQLDQLASLDLEVEARSIAWLITAAYITEVARSLDVSELAAALYPLLAGQSGQAIVVIGVAATAASTGNRDILEPPPLTARTQVDYEGMLPRPRRSR